MWGGLHTESRGARQPFFSGNGGLQLCLINTKCRTFSHLGLLLLSGWTHWGSLNPFSWAYGSVLTEVSFHPRGLGSWMWGLYSGEAAGGFPSPAPNLTAGAMACYHLMLCGMWLIWTNAQTFSPASTCKLIVHLKAQKWCSETKQDPYF